MRWVRFAILALVALLLQTTVLRLLAVTVPTVGTVGPDALAIVAVFVALTVRHTLDAMLAAWALGLALDLTTAGTGLSAPVGLMPVAYALAAGAVFRVREGFFRERAVTQALLTMIFCLMAHGIWVSAQSLLAYRRMSWADYRLLLMQVAMVSAYSAVLMPLCWRGLVRLQGQVIHLHAGRSRRYRR